MSDPHSSVSNFLIGQNFRDQKTGSKTELTVTIVGLGFAIAVKMSAKRGCNFVEISSVFGDDGYTPFGVQNGGPFFN